MLCYITLFYVTLYNMLCYVSYITRYVYVMFYNMSCYVTCYVMQYNIFMLYNMLYCVMFMLYLLYKM